MNAYSHDPSPLENHATATGYKLSAVRNLFLELTVYGAPDCYYDVSGTLPTALMQDQASGRQNIPSTCRSWTPWPPRASAWTPRAPVIIQRESFLRALLVPRTNLRKWAKKAKKPGAGLPPVSEAAAEAAAAPGVDDIRNRGLKAWLQTYYEANLLRDSTPAVISWIGSIQGALLLGGGGLAGPLFNAGYFRALISTGTPAAGLHLVGDVLRRRGGDTHAGQAAADAVALRPKASFSSCRSSYALGHGMAHTRDLALNLIAILNGASVLGRLAPSLVTPRIGPLNTMTGVAAMAGAVAFGRTGVKGVAGNVAFAILYGFSSGGIVPLPAVVSTPITEDMSFFGARMGTSSLFNAAGSLCGPPIAGAILRAQDSEYLGLQLFAAVAISRTFLCLWGVRVARIGPGLVFKV
ncbi:hypothetical protein GGTG_13366 [Gaeumannomyces tritici R3-111a-1]|uniref:Major facilitator superfamily (MFS) profile domain-containing protein n=1 Tax=Gaeumannomyces tritici (strain R3-111a-1) TaxID=644352 RepID=J3PIN7_GAET3|nr:hypothetical protein GGTG_13366 [Gaeumannomyces tritici R3-111a-1]EJT69098.1 hypothetical protein GGTG_13366 [Gaeumannomyces tritici R3-111a-1]